MDISEIFFRGQKIEYRILRSVFAALFMLILMSCRTAPIQPIENEPVRINKLNYTLEDVERAIIKGGIGMGWEMYRQQPGTIEGTLHIGQHTVEVTIPYNRESYSIDYKDSKNMLYDSGSIHKSYHRWIENLNKAIKLSFYSTF